MSTESKSGYNLRARHPAANGAAKSSANNHQISGDDNGGQVQNGQLANSASNKRARHHSSHHLTDTQKKDIDSLVLWKRPGKTIYHASLETFDLLIKLSKWVLSHRKLCSSVLLVLITFCLSAYIQGPHLPWVQFISKKIVWYSWWIFLGVLSSVGLGTGLHTFILYLGPHIASVTLAAYECNSLDFPEPPYPDEIICPTTTTAATATVAAITVWSIMRKVSMEAFCWGAGTALGELPPYFISRAHRLAGDSQDDMLEEFEELEDLVGSELENSSDDHDSDENEESLAVAKQKKSPTTASANRRHSVVGSMKGNMVHFMKKMGFFGILACASIPNPLFDLAGIICGYTLIPFWTFFGATLIGKAIIKMHIQQLVVIIVFNEKYVHTVLNVSKNIPYIGAYIHGPLRDYLEEQKKSLHRGANQAVDVKGRSWLGTLFDAFVISMILYFLVSIIHSMAQSNLKHRYHQELELKKSKSSAQNGAVSSNNKSSNVDSADSKDAKTD